MFRIMLASLLLGGFVTAANAQATTDRPQPSARRAQRGTARADWPTRMFERIARRLDLDEDQRAQFDELTKTQRAEMREMGARWRELRQAQRDGDTERVAQLRAEMPAWNGPGSGLAETLDKLEPILRPEQVERLWEIEDQMQRRQRMRAQYRAVTRDLPDQLNLDDQQRQEFDDLLKSQRETMRQRWTEMRPLMRKLRDAIDAGDDEQIEELRAQIDAARPDPDQMFAEFFDKLASHLDDDQIAKLKEFRQQWTPPAGDHVSLDNLTIREVFRAVKQLRLDRDQKAQIRDIQREALGKYRKIGRRDHEGQARLADDVRKQIAELLDDEQLDRFDAQLRRYAKRRKP